MLINFFHSLRDVGIPVTTRELLDLYEGLSRHVAFGSADEFYFFSRTCLVKDEKYFDRFDKAFGAHFEELQDLDDIIEAMIPDDWLRSEFTKAAVGRGQGQDRVPRRPGEADRGVQEAPRGAEETPRGRQQVDRHRRHFTLRPGGLPPRGDARRAQRWQPQGGQGLGSTRFQEPG
jgi:uncharacterized protein with von Willebrand factor type A (vWA) domain